MEPNPTSETPATTIAAQIITYELLLGILVFITYIYIYTIKAAYLAYFHIPQEYTDIDLAELLHNSWVLGAFLELLLFGLYGYFIVLSIDLTKFLLDTLLWKKFTFSHKRKWIANYSLILAIQLLNLLVFCWIYFRFFLATEKTLGIVNLDSGGNTELNFVLIRFILHDVFDSPELILATILTACLVWLIRNRQIQKGDPLYPLKTFIIYGFCACSFLFTVFLYTGAVDLGKNYAEARRIYPFIKENGKLTPQMIVSTFDGDYIVITVQKDRTNQYYLAPNINDGTFKFVAKNEKNLAIINMRLINGLQTEPIPSSEEELFKRNKPKYLR